MTQLNTQAMDALLKANQYRSRKARDKLKIKRRELSPASILREPPEHWANARVVELLVAMHYVGRRKASHWLKMAAIHPSEPIARIDDWNRDRLARHLEAAERRKDLAVA